MFRIETLHHVSVPVRNLDESMRFYEEVLGLARIERPPFGFGGAWYQLGDRQLHLICDEKVKATFREAKRLDSRDVHFAIRVASYRETRDYLRSKGYHKDADDELMEMKESPDNPTNWRQLYIMDPNRNVIELNAERLGEEV